MLQLKAPFRVSISAQGAKDAHFIKREASLIENDVTITSETLPSRSPPMSLTIRYFHNNLKTETL
jgi:hypothetical protein